MLTDERPGGAGIGPERAAGPERVYAGGTIPPMDVEAEYRRQIAGLSAAERMRRAQRLLLWSREVLRREILARTPPPDERELRSAIALRLYGSDPRMRALIEGWRRRAAD